MPSLAQLPGGRNKTNMQTKVGLHTGLYWGKKGFFVYPSPNPWPISRLCPKMPAICLEYGFGVYLDTRVMQGLHR